MNGLTKRQRAVLRFLLEGVVANGYQPSYREMAKGLGFSHPSGLMCHIKALAKKGYISQNQIKSRALVINWTALGIQKRHVQGSVRSVGRLVRSLP